ncbi:hypothetical protein B8W67_18615 [Mycolicibacillus koreensis]|uniref:Secreted protein n=1 Tax=Mycolicibacillus koreensis TaxID=1069220 RepID=A0AA91PBM7_9MYCO|nr:hypothetical protein B8W67_18615 [Mycolicibacillus koreensis]
MTGYLVPTASVITALLIAAAEPAWADPTADEIAPPLPAVVATPSNWQPKFPFPYDQTRDEITDADITAVREMCQWFAAQYDTLTTQIDNFNNALIRYNGDYSAGSNQQIADAVTANIDRSVAYLTPRAQALTQSVNHAGDLYFPMYGAKSFHLLWQHLSNVSAGIRGRQPAWFVGPSFQRAMRWGSDIHRSHVCD